MHRKIINLSMKWLENTIKICLLLTILRLESFVETGVRDLEMKQARWSTRVKKSIQPFLRFSQKRSNSKITTKLLHQWS